MFGAIKRNLKQSVLRALDNHARYRTDRFKNKPAPEIWGMTTNEAGHLAIGDIDLVDVADTYGTPLHIVNGVRLENNYKHFLSCFTKHYPYIDIGYSYKTNPLPVVIRKIHQLGASAEVISHFELWLALRLGVQPENIIFNGPGKTVESLRLAVEKGIRIVNIDGLDEIPTLAALSEEYDTVQSVGLRLVASVGWSGQFGFPIANGLAWEAVEQIQKEARLNLVGLHIHLGTGIKDVALYVQAIGEVLEFAQRLKREAGIAVKFLDFGGGFGIPTVSPYTPLDRHLIEGGFPPWPADFSQPSPLDEYAKLIIDKVTDYYDPNDENAPTLVFEPGRAITGSAQTLLLRVLTVKPSATEAKSVILDGGRNLIMPPNWEHHAVLAASKLKSSGVGYYNLYGPLCHPGDLLFRGHWLPEMEKGDCLSIMDSGAYFVPNQMNFSNPRTAAVMVEDGEVHMVRERETFEQMIAMDPV